MCEACGLDKDEDIVLVGKVLTPEQGALAQTVYQSMLMNASHIQTMSQSMEAQYLKVWKAQYNSYLAQVGTKIRVWRIPSIVKSRFRQMSNNEAGKVAHTFNNDLWKKIRAILEANPNATSSQLKSEIAAWAANREKWKVPQIALYTERHATFLAGQDFLSQNRRAVKGTAHVEPQTAVCDRCKELIALGEIDINDTRQHRCPVHVNCVHEWVLNLEVVSRLGILENLIVRFLES